MIKRGILFLLLLGALLATQCRTSTDITVTAETFYETELFRDVQLARMFEDSKTFVDLARDRTCRKGNGSGLTFRTLSMSIFRIRGALHPVSRRT